MALDENRRRLRQRAYYQARPALVRAANQQNYARKRAFIDAFKNTPCADCGVSYPSCVMDFDHRESEQKLFEIGANWGRSRDALATEIAKCDVVCANCHRLRTHARRQDAVA